MSNNDLLIFYTSAIRPILEYACMIWHHRLTAAQTERLEALQRRALRIIYNCTWGMPYILVLSYANIPSLRARREQLSRDFFKTIMDPSSCLHHLLPPERDQQITSRLRHCNKFPVPRTRTKKFTSPIFYFLANYQ